MASKTIARTLRFRNAGIFTLVGRGAGHKAVWRLSPSVLEYYATQEALA